MKDLFEKLEGHIVTHLWDIERSVSERDGFTCHQQVDDVRDCLEALCKMRQILDHEK